MMGQSGRRSHNGVFGAFADVEAYVNRREIPGRSSAIQGVLSVDR